MVGEAIQFVKEAEEQARKIEAEAQMKKQQILAAAKETVVLKEAQVHAFLTEYQTEKKQQYQNQLELEKSRLIEEYEEQLNKLTQQVATKKTEAVEEIVREVVRQYGHR